MVIQFVQPTVEVEHSGAAIDNASDLLTAVMGLKTVLMAVMRLDVVSNHSGWTIVIIAIAYACSK